MCICPVYPCNCSKLPNSRFKERKTIYRKICKALHLRCWLVCCLFGHTGNISDVTLAFEDTQVIPPFSREESDDTDKTDDTDNTDTNDKEDTDDTDETDDTNNTDDTDDTEHTNSLE